MTPCFGLALCKKMTPAIALYKPQIPPNTGNISRLAVAVNAALHIVGKPAFSLDQKDLIRAGLDHWNALDLHLHQRFRDFYASRGVSRIVAVSKDAPVQYSDFMFQPDDILLFGNETQGLPPTLLSRCEHIVKIPMWGAVRSLNLSNAVAIVVYEAIRQGLAKGWIDQSSREYHRTYYRSPYASN